MGDQLDRTVEVVGELREVLVEGRQLLSDLRAERKELERRMADARALIESYTAEHVENKMAPLLREELEQLKPMVAENRDRILERIDQVMDEYFNLARFGNKQGRGEDIFEQLGVESHRRHRLLRGRSNGG